MRYFILTSCIIALASCKEKTQNISKVAVTPDTTQLRMKLEKSRKDADDDYEVLFNNDTLKIVTANDFLFYPFGKHARVNDITKQVTNSVIKKLWLKDLYSADSTEVTQIMASKSRVKLIFDEEQNRQQILSALIVDTNFALKNNVRIGMNKNALLGILFKNPPVISTNIIKLISAVEGIEHYYYFKDNKLYKIIMVTDYILKDKDE